MSFRSATKEDVSKSGFLYVRNTTTQEITKVASVSNFQVGLIKSPADLTITGDLNVSGDAIFEGIVKYNAGLSGSLTRLADDTSYLVAGSNITITSASNGQVTISAAATSGAPIDASYVVLGANGDLTSERILTAGSGISIVDSGAGGNVTISATGGTGDVVGPASATDNAIARFDLTTGKLIQNSGVTIDDSDNVTTPGDIAVNGGDITTTSATFNLVNAAATINLGSTAVTRAINIGTNATNVQTIGIGTGNAANVITIGSNAASSATVSGGDALNLYADAGAITMDSGGSGGTGTISVGTFGYAQTISVGNTTGATSLAFRAGTGGITFETAATASSNLTVTGDLAVNGGDITTTSATFNLVNAATTINLGSTAVTRAINIGTNATNVQTIGIGTGNAANVISIGSNAASSTSINGGDALNLYADAGAITMDSGGVSGTGTISIGTFGYAQTISIGNTTGATSLAFRAGSGGITFETAVTASSNLTVTGDIAVNGGDITTTSATFNLVNAATTINLGSTAVVRSINIGTGGAAQTISIGNFAVGTTTSVSGLTLNLYSSGGTVTIDSAGTGGTVNIDNFGYNSTVNVGTGAAVKTVTVGSTNTTSTTSIQGGTGGVSINSSHATLADATIGNATVGEHPKLSYAGFAIFGHSSYDYNTSPGSYALLAVGSAGTKNTWLNAPTGGQIRFANNDTTIGFMDDNEVSLTGKSGTATTTTLGNTVSTSSTVINAGSGSIDIGTSDSIRSINIGKTDTAAQTISIGGGGANTIGIGNFAIGSTTTVSGLTLNMYSSGGTVSIDSAGTGGTVNIDTFGYNSTVNVGTGPAVKTVTVGSTNTTSTTAIQAGSGGITLTGNATLSGDLAVNGGDITTTSATFNLVNAATTINLGSTAVTRAINIGTNATNVQTIGIGTGNAANVISIGSNAASSASVNGGDALNLYADAGAITMDSGGPGGTGTISIGIFGYAQTISVGNTTGATSLAFRAGSGGITFETNVTASGDIAVNGGDITTTAATFNLVNAATTINLGSTAVTRAINIGSNATNVQTIGIGNGAAANIITVGSTTGAASLTLQAGTGNFSLTGAAGTTYTIGPAARTGIISIGNSTATNTIEIGNGSIASGAQQTIDVCAANITNNASAYRIINIGTGTGGGTAGVANFTSQNRVLVGKVQSGAGYTAVAIQGDYIWIGKDGTTNPTNSLIGFFGATPVAKQTVASDTLANLYTALRNYGLIV